MLIPANRNTLDVLSKLRTCKSCSLPQDYVSCTSFRHRHEYIHIYVHVIKLAIKCMLRSNSTKTDYANAIFKFHCKDAQSSLKGSSKSGSSLVVYNPHKDKTASQKPLS